MNNNLSLRMPDLIPDPTPAELEEILPKVELIDSDGEPMDSDWHRRAMNLLIESAEHHFRERLDFYTGGNMFIYFSEEQARNRDFRGPDFYFVWKTTRLPQRRYWAVWLEGGRTPNVVIELNSPTTRSLDHGEKKDIYEQILHVADYFCYDPDGDRLNGWRLHGREYASLEPNEQGWLWSEELQLWLGAWKGKSSEYEGIYPRFFDRDGNLVLTETEAARQEARDVKRLLEEERRKVDEERRKVEEARTLAESERSRRETVESEMAHLRERLASLEMRRQASDNGGNRAS